MKVHKILFITLSNIGDAILTLPVLDVLWQRFPDAKIDVLVGPRPKEIFASHPKIHSVMVYNKHASVAEKIRLFWKFQGEHYDLVIDLRNTAYGVLVPAKHKITPLLQAVRTRHMREKHLRGVSVLLKNTQEISRQGIAISRQGDEYINTLLKNHGVGERDDIVVVSPGARSHLKRWSEEGFVAVCDAVSQEFGCRIILVGDTGDMKVAARIASHTKEKVVDMSGATNITQLASLLKRARLLIANDSAVLHLASYLDVPVVAMFGPTDETKYGPWSRRSKVVKKDIHCRPCMKSDCKYNTIDCMRLIKPQDVMKAVRDLLASVPVPPIAQSNSFNRILLIRTDRVGDLVLSTPVIKAVRQAYPQAYIAMLVTPYTKDIVEGNPYLDEVLVYDKDGAQRNLLGILRLARQLKMNKFDVALVLHPTDRVHALTFFAGIPRRIGYDRKLSFVLTDRIPYEKNTGQKHEVEYSLDMVRYLGIEPKDTSLYMPLKREAEVWVDRVLKEHGVSADDTLIVLHPSANCPSKVWPVERFAQVANELILQYSAKIIVVASEKDAGIAQNMIRLIRSRVIDLSGKTNLSQLTSLLKRASLFISNDTGPVHIASAVGTPVISIFGRGQAGSSPKRWGPWGGKGVSLHKPTGCIECVANNCTKEFACLKAITVEDVLKAVHLVLGDGSQK